MGKKRVLGSWVAVPDAPGLYQRAKRNEAAGPGEAGTKTERPVVQNMRRKLRALIDESNQRLAGRA